MNLPKEHLVQVMHKCETRENGSRGDLAFGKTFRFRSGTAYQVQIDGSVRAAKQKLTKAERKAAKRKRCQERFAEALDKAREMLSRGQNNFVIPARASASFRTLHSALRTPDEVAASALAALPEMTGDALPRDIQIFPPGDRVEFTLHDHPGENFFLKVDATVAARAQADLEKLLARAAAGKGPKPFADKNHEDAEATFHPSRIFWAGDDRTTGGVRVETNWTGFGASLVKARAMSYFSGNFLFNKKTGQFLGLLNENIGGLVNRPGFATQQAFAKGSAAAPGEASNHKTTDTMTDQEIQNAITNGITAGLKPVVSRLDTLEASAKGATATGAQPADNIVKLLDDRLKPIAEDLKSLKERDTNNVAAAAKATVQTVGVKAGRIAAQDAETIKFWEEAIAANAKAADALAKMPINPAFVQVIHASAKAGTATFGNLPNDPATTEKIVAKAKAYRKDCGSFDEAWQRARAEVIAGK